MTAETSSGQVVGAQKDKEAGKMSLVVRKTTQNKPSKTLQSKYPPSRGAKNPKKTPLEVELGNQRRRERRNWESSWHPCDTQHPPNVDADELLQRNESLSLPNAAFGLGHRAVVLCGSAARSGPWAESPDWSRDAVCGEALCKASTGEVVTWESGVQGQPEVRRLHPKIPTNQQSKLWLQVFP